jgi:hypothetical protein
VNIRIEKLGGCFHRHDLENFEGRSTCSYLSAEFPTNCAVLASLVDVVSSTLILLVIQTFDGKSSRGILDIFEDMGTIRRLCYLSLLSHLYLQSCTGFKQCAFRNRDLSARLLSRPAAILRI